MMRILLITHAINVIFAIYYSSFFFKQKTAYEMRISDWSSDVCSSDLTWQGRHPPSVDRPYTAVFAGNHGIARQGVSAYPAEVTAQMVQNFIDGGAAVNQLCTLANADLRVYEMALEEPTGDISKEPAMSEIDGCHALAYGMMAVEPGIEIGRAHG